MLILRLISDHFFNFAKSYSQNFALNAHLKIQASKKEAEASF